MVNVQQLIYFLVVLHIQEKQEAYYLQSGENIFKFDFPSIFSVRANVLTEHKTRRPYCPAGGAGEIATLSLKTKTKKKVVCIYSLRFLPVEGLS